MRVQETINNFRYIHQFQRPFIQFSEMGLIQNRRECILINVFLRNEKKNSCNFHFPPKV